MSKEYGIRKKTSLSYDDAVARIRQLLGENGFGVLTEIDMKEKLKEKLGVEIQRYVILGACNPPLAYKALQSEKEIGLLLPCNVIVYEEGDGTVVAAMDPMVMAEVIPDNAMLAEVARDAREKLVKALNAL
jgi:uncharacterized protein (DUF302 family)